MKELNIQRFILFIGIFFIIGGGSFFSEFIINPSYFYGIGFFVTNIIGVGFILYREERLERFILSLGDEQ